MKKKKRHGKLNRCKVFFSLARIGFAITWPSTVFIFHANLFDKRIEITHYRDIPPFALALVDNKLNCTEFTDLFSVERLCHLCTTNESRLKWYNFTTRTAQLRFNRHAVCLCATQFSSCFSFTRNQWCARALLSFGPSHWFSDSFGDNKTTEATTTPAKTKKRWMLKDLQFARFQMSKYELNEDGDRIEPNRTNRSNTKHNKWNCRNKFQTKNWRRRRRADTNTHARTTSAASRRWIFNYNRVAAESVKITHWMNVSTRAPLPRSFFVCSFTRAAW